YTLIAGIAFIIRYLQTHRGLIPGLILIGISIILIFSVTLPDAFKWFYGVTEFLDSFCPIILIAFGFFVLFNKSLFLFFFYITLIYSFKLFYVCIYFLISFCPIILIYLGFYVLFKKR